MSEWTTPGLERRDPPQDFGTLLYFMVKSAQLLDIG